MSTTIYLIGGPADLQKHVVPRADYQYRVAVPPPLNLKDLCQRNDLPPTFRVAIYEPVGRSRYGTVYEYIREES